VPKTDPSFEAHPLYKAVEASAAASASYGYGSFVETIGLYLKKQIDTPEERDQVLKAALLAFDHFIAPRLGQLTAQSLRPVISAVIGNLLINLGA
jgi:hypothetical protein